MANKILAKVQRNVLDTFVFQTTEFKGKTYIDIRTFYTDSAGELQPTKKGINIPKDAYQAFRRALKEAETQMIADGIFDPEDLED
jgi:hypothetical protein